MQTKRIVSNHLESNTYVIGIADECVIVDAGAEIGDVIKAAEGKRVVGILLTHGHFDHAFNILEYAAYFSCKIYASKKAEINLSDPNKNYCENFAISDFKDFVWVDDGSVLSLGKYFNISCYAMPGHSACSMGYLIETTLFAGDFLFKQGVGRMDLYDSSKQSMFSSLQKVKIIPFEIVASGHGEISTVAEQKRNIEIFIKFLSR